MVSFSGVGSGLDLSSLVTQVVAAEKIPANQLAKRKTATNRQATVLGDLVSKLKSLDTKLKGFDTASELRAVTAASSDTARVKITASGEAAAGNHRVAVNKLARGQSSQSIAFASLTSKVPAAGTLSIQVGNDAAAAITFGTNDTIEDIAARIGDSDADVSASVVYTGSEYRLVVNSKETGLENAITFSESGGSLGFNASGSLLSAAQDAEISLNGMTITRPTNQMSDVLKGITLDLISETPSGGSETALTLTTDKSAVKTKVKEFVDGYNEIAKAMLTQMDESAANKDGNNLFGDSSLQALQRSLGGVIAGGYAHSGDTTSLGGMGIKIGSDGMLSIDDAKFDKAYLADPTRIESLLAGQDGIVKKLGEVIDQYTRAGDGVLVARQAGLRTRVNSFDKEIERINDRAEAIGARMTKQFAALDQTMTNLQSQTSYLAALFA